ncbi:MULTISPECIES: MaoC/PaaZ C-terminal domain-containing protein [Rhodococcus]|nr:MULTISPECIES: MaoC/PaaZ C-terminal domain-containing protein [Rhodococcus]
MTFETPRRTVTEADVVNFAGVSGDFHTLHTDAQTMRESQFGERIAHGALVLSIVTGLRGRLGIFDDTLVAFAEIRRWRFVRPVLIGDTIRAANEVVELTPTSKPDRGVMVQHVQVLNQHDVVVQEGEMVALVKREAKV